MAYYLKFPADTGSTNSYLVQISGVSGSAVISYKLAEDQPIFDNRAIYLFDIRRSLNSTSSSGGTGFILRTNTGSINTSGTTNHKINGSSVSGNDLFKSNPLEDDVCEFETTSSVTNGVFSFGGRFNEVEGFSELAVKSIVVTDNNGTHTIDMSDSGGTLSTFDSTDGAITLTLINFPNDNSQWVFYSVGGGTETETLYSLNITSKYLQRLEIPLLISSAYKELLESGFNISSKYLERSSSSLDISSAYSERLTNTINVNSAYQQRQINTLNIASAYTQRLTTTLSIESAYYERYSGALNITSVYLTDSSDTIYSLNIASKYLARSIGTLNIESDYKERLIDSLNIASSYKQLEVNTLSIESAYLQREQSTLNITSGYQERLAGTLVITTKYNGEPVTIRRTPTVQVFITEASNSISITEPTTQITIIG